MTDLRAAQIPQSQASAVTGRGERIGFGTDVTAEVERLRASILALAIVVDEVRTRLNGHGHGGAVPPLPLAERATTPFIPT
jgi:hypothetical protein